MVTINSAELVDVYKDQEHRLRPSAVPPTGTYDVVGTEVEPVLNIGDRDSKKYSVSLLILKVCSSDDAAASEFVGETFKIDLWRDFTKKVDLYKIGCMAIAVTRDTKKVWDPENAKDVIANLTGIPFRISITTVKRKTSNFHDCQPVKFDALAAKEIKTYLDDPDIAKAIPKAEARMLPVNDASTRAAEAGGGQRRRSGGGGEGGGGGGKRNGASADPFKDNAGFDPNDYAT